MKLVNSILIHRPAAAVWAFLENPENMRLWNPNVKHVSPSVFSRPRQGYHYAIIYQLGDSAKATEFTAEFIHYEPSSRLVIRLSERASASGRVIDETYDLTERDGGTFLQQTIAVGNSGINIFVRLLIWIIQRWGKPTGKPYLATLRDCVESGGEQDRSVIDAKP